MEKRPPLRFSLNKGFTAKPVMKEDGVTDILHWRCLIPGPKDVKFTKRQYGKKGPIRLKWILAVIIL